MPEELEGRAVQHIGPGFGREVDHAAVEPAEFRRRAVGFDLEFLNGIHDREERHLAGLGLQHRDPVEKVLVGARPAAIDPRERLTRWQRHGRDERDQRDEATAVERQRRDLLFRDHLPQTRARAQGGRRGSDGNRLADVADHQRNIQAYRHTGLDADALMTHAAEPREHDVDGVDAWR